MKNRYFVKLATWLFLVGATGIASATSITAHITADNHYGLYYGDVTGATLTYVGRNEIGTGGNPGAHNWTLPETFTFNTAADDYLYVAAWDDGGPQMWTADFFTGSGLTPSLVTDQTNWQYIAGDLTTLSGSNPQPVTIADMQTAISSASWQSIGAAVAHGSSPWGNIAGVDDTAKYIWGDTTAAGGGSFQIFRASSVPTSVHEPITLAILALGLTGIGFSRRKRLN